MYNELLTSLYGAFVFRIYVDSQVVRIRFYRLPVLACSGSDARFRPIYSVGLNEVQIKFEFYKRSFNFEKKNEFNIPKVNTHLVSIVFFKTHATAGACLKLSIAAIKYLTGQM